MRKILDYLDKIDSELENAKEYAENYLQLKIDDNNEWSMKFKAMSENELQHAANIRELATIDMNKLKSVCNLPTAMQEAWDKSHTRYVEQVAWIKQMLAM